MGEIKPMPNPTKGHLSDPLFEAIWQTIKSWDVNVPEYYEGYCGANGSHVVLILQAIRKALIEEEEDDDDGTVTLNKDEFDLLVKKFREQ